MGYAVLHLDKASANEVKMTAHIERTQMPKNADPERTHLNRELIKFPEGVADRTQATQHRLDNAGLIRKIGTNQVRAIRIVLTGSNKDMKRIEEEGKLDEWCEDNLEWLRKTYGADNLVSAVLHLDEATPHLHATIIPIVTGERRKVRENRDKPGKKKYRKKDPNAARLCADDVMTRIKLKEYQDSYAQAMSKYGLERGIVGSDARHISTQEFYSKVMAQKGNLQEDIELLIQAAEAKREDIKYLEKREDEVKDKISYMYDRRDEVRDLFLDLHNRAEQKQKELSDFAIHIEQLKQDYEPYKAQDELNTIHKLFPIMKEQLRIAALCENVGLAFGSVQSLLAGKTLTAETFNFYSAEHDRHFDAKDVRLKIEAEPDIPQKLRLSLNGQNIIDWFKQKFEELKQILGFKTPTVPNQNRRSSPKL